MYACDVSEFQVPVTDTYPHRWLIFRACDGDYRDHNAAQNLAWCKKAKAAGKLDGYTLYSVYRPGQNSAILDTLDALGVPKDCHLMIDAESWGNAITGNHSPEINSLADRLAARNGRGNVWGYANRGDYASVWPSRPSWLGLVVASYGSSKPSSPGPGPLVGWQYSDGQDSNPVPAGAPRSSAPFGRCDHNQLFVGAAPSGGTGTKLGTGLMADKLDPYVVEQLRNIIREEVPALIKAQLARLTPYVARQIRNIVHQEIGKFTHLGVKDKGTHLFSTVVAKFSRKG